MLQIRFSNGNILRLYMGDQDMITFGDARITSEVEATGKELEAILQQCSYLPMTTRLALYPEHERVMHWYGDHARFIVGNVKL